MADESGTVQDRMEIENLHSLFFHLVDRRNFPALKKLYTADAYEDRGAYEGDVDGFIAWAAETYKAIKMASHMMTNILYRFDGDAAETEGREVTYVTLDGIMPTNVLIVSRQFDRYRREGGKWLFRRRALCTDWVQVMPITAPFRAIDAMPLGSATLDDPVFKQLPALAVLLHGAKSSASA